MNANYEGRPFRRLPRQRNVRADHFLLSVALLGSHLVHLLSADSLENCPVLER